ncbi:MAG: hypothetical protein HY290_30290 [Planctomycetia bacterium]|nr:hypothetical protein [Planctomycetia bacterium]
MGIGCLGGLVLGPLVGLVGYLIGNPLFDSEIGPMPVLWALGFDGLFAGGFLGVIAGAVIDVVRERSAPAVLALLGLLAMAAPIVILIVLALMC